jgi:hypothetical protein
LADFTFTLASGVTASDFVASISAVSYQLEGGDLVNASAPIPRTAEGYVAGVGGVSEGVLSLSNDVGELLTPGDNEFHWTQDTASDGVLKLQFDTNPSVGQTQLSEVMEIHGITSALTADQLLVMPVL